MELKTLTGTWLETLGTILNALGITKALPFSLSFRNNCSLWGNVLQATGNGLSAEEEDFKYRLGLELQSVGNLTIIYGILLPINHREDLRKFITGNWLQTLGTLVCFSHSVVNEKTPHDRVGCLLQAIGNSLQAIAGIEELKAPIQNLNMDITDILEFSGSWVQVIGSLMSSLEYTASLNNDELEDKKEK
ncbi:DUF6944 family repetitive protein [Terrilactibacillus tamarindi]|nr:hypothetical protein [Terrilactibacillus tamarindi]